ncbi:MAG: PEPxxWA-CTERM sorting domain-containing protein [Pseudomonadota bacterium]
MSRLKTALLTFSIATSISASAQAATVILDVGTMENARTVTIAGIGNVQAAPMQFKASIDGKPTSLLAWCVDVYHTIQAKDYSPNLVYEDTKDLTTDFNGQTLDDGDVYKVGLLANYGQYVFDNVPEAPDAFTLKEPKRNQYPNGSAGTAAYNKAKSDYNAAKTAYNNAVSAFNAAKTKRNTLLSAVQGAIWQVVSNRNVYSNDNAFDQLVDKLSAAPAANFDAGYTVRFAGIDLITPVQQYGGKYGKTPLPLTQSFVFGTGAVPEPATWALMISGLGLAGAALRRRRTQIACA